VLGEFIIKQLSCERKSARKYKLSQKVKVKKVAFVLLSVKVEQMQLSLFLETDEYFRQRCPAVEISS